MSKYLDNKNEVNMNKIQEEFDRLSVKAGDLAKATTDDLVDDIKYYREHSFEQIESDIKRDFESEFYDQNNYNDESDLENHIINRCAVYLQSKNDWDKTTGHYEKKVKHLSKEERESILQEIYDERVAKFREKDIAYDLLTEEQISKLVELYYNYSLKHQLKHAKERAVIHVTDPKFLRYGDLEDEIAEVMEYDQQTQMDIAKKKQVKEIFKGVMPMIGSASAFGLTAAIGILLQNGHGLTDPASSILGISSALTFLSSLVLPLTGVSNIKRFFESKKALNKAKELGLYDKIVDEIKACDDLKSYLEELGFDDTLAEVGVVRIGDGYAI